MLKVANIQEAQLITALCVVYKVVPPKFKYISTKPKALTFNVLKKHRGQEDDKML